MINEVTALVGFLGGVMIGWGIRGYLEIRRSENLNEKQTKPWLDKK